jgi:hypothetical protein
MGGKSHPDNSQMVNFEMQQAQQAADKEAARQQRLNTGTQQINDIFGNANFDQNFYDKYTKAITGYQMPQLQDQYTQAQNKLTYDLARAGTLNSTGAGYAQGLLAKQNLNEQASITAGADQQTSALRNQILNEKQTAINQLYSTEDPTIAANTASSMVAQNQITQPNLNPLGAIFTPLAVGGAGALQSSINNYYTQRGMQAAAPDNSTGVVYGGG